MFQFLKINLQVQRAVGYDKVKNEVAKWDNIVKSNRKAEQLIFPLTEPAIHMPTSKEFSSKFKVKAAVNHTNRYIFKLSTMNVNILASYPARAANQ